MNFLPKGSGTRPRVACEIAPEGVVAARSAEAGGAISGVARIPLAPGAVNPGLKPGNIVDRTAVVTALRRALEGIGGRPNGRGGDVSLIIPDSAVRVLLLDFDALPGKLSEALPIVRFRLKKLLPFEADDAMITYQAQSQSRMGVRVLAVAIPRDVLAEYETAAREAGFEPGVVLPSTLAALPAVADDEPALLVNAGIHGLTTAILRGGQLLLHRSVDLHGGAATLAPADLPAGSFKSAGSFESSATLPLVDLEDSAGEWSAQQPLPEHGRNPYADRLADEAAVQGFDGVTGLPVSPAFSAEGRTGRAGAIARGIDQQKHSEPGSIFASPYAASPYGSPTLDADLDSELHNAILIAPTSLGSLTDPAAAEQLQAIAAAALGDNGRPDPDARTPAWGRPATLSHELSQEIAHAVSVAAAYFEDTLSVMPRTVLSAGPMGAEALGSILQAHGVAQADDLRVRELVEASALAADAVTAAVPRSALAGVAGALRG